MDKKFKLFVIFALLTLSVSIAVGTFFMFKAMNNANQVSAVGAEGEQIIEKDLEIIELGDAVTANILDEYEEQHITRIEVGFAIDSKSKQAKTFLKELESKKLMVRDEVIQILREQTYEMMQKKDAKEKVGDEITSRINKLLNTNTIKKVYFGDFFVQ